ncbi:hypothetical protein M9H77_07640 [Catharanthus roseus]|uniref:Uncharacterized protein n=1 Tax=Catharanthus roseus TaxID=4058 RepID=A0ACC0BVJ7_CATRO|nr:hypothetical protein M9H77_07640 [Catharanthus roseus]
MLCGSGYFLAGWVRRGPPARVAQGGLAGIDYGMPELVPMTPFKVPDSVLLRGTQVHYSAAVDLAEEYGFYSSCLVRPLDTAGRLTAKTTLMRGTLEAQ